MMNNFDYECWQLFTASMTEGDSKMSEVTFELF